MAKVWNITDHPKTSVESRVMMVLGRSVRPGKCINVPEDRLAKAHKVHRAVEAKKLAIGPRPPHDYMMAKRPPKVELPKGVARAHGTIDVAPEKTETVLEEEVEVKEEVTTELKPSSESEEPTADASAEEEGSKSSKEKKKRGRW